MTAFRLLAPLIAILPLAGPASAGPINGGFEAGDFTGWSATGDALVVTASVGATPTQGTYLALVTTASANGDDDGSGQLPLSGTDAVSAVDLRTFLGLTGMAIPDAFEGSAIRQTFAATAGEVIRFDFQFLTTEGAANDFAFATINGTVYLLADTTSGPFAPSGVVLDPVFLAPTAGTGWRTFSFAIPTAGTYTVGIGVADADDEFNPSGLLVDNARLAPANGGGTVPIPEPSFLLIAALGVASTALRRRRSAALAG